MYQTQIHSPCLPPSLVVDAGILPGQRTHIKLCKLNLCNASLIAWSSGNSSCPAYSLTLQNRIMVACMRWTHPSDFPGPLPDGGESFLRPFSHYSALSTILCSVIHPSGHDHLSIRVRSTDPMESAGLPVFAQIQNIGQPDLVDELDFTQFMSIS